MQNVRSAASPSTARAPFGTPAGVRLATRTSSPRSSRIRARTDPTCPAPKTTDPLVTFIFSACAPRVIEPLFQRSPVDAPRSRVGAHWEAVRDLECLQIDLDDAVVVAQTEIRARSIGHDVHPAVARVATGYLQLLDRFARGGVDHDERAGASVEDEHL